MKLKLKFRVEERPDCSPSDFFERPNDVVVMLGEVDIVRIPIKHTGPVYDEGYAQELIVEAVTPFIERMFAPIQTMINPEDVAGFPGGTR